MLSKHQRNPKSQTPNPNKIRNRKFQISPSSWFVWVFVIWSFFGIWDLGLRSSLAPASLRCEYLSSPLGLDEPHPRLSWRIESFERGERQTAYQIVVASTTYKLSKFGSPDLWDSGKVSGSESVNIVYSGKPLVSRQQCFWKVRVWNKDGELSDWSQTAAWSMGLLKPEDWKADYISFR